MSMQNIKSEGTAAMNAGIVEPVESKKAGEESLAPKKLELWGEFLTY